MAQNLQSKGWCINEQALELELDLAEQSDRLGDVKRLEEFLLDTDLKEVGNPVLYEKFDRKKGELVGPLILQLVKWRNLNYPIVNNHDRNDGVCSMALSDGHSSIKTVSIDPISKIDGNTTYGSKILLTGKIRSENGFLLLNNKNTTNLGGNVEKLVEKWRTEKYSGNERSSTNAPKWVSFSKAKNLNIKFDKNFRTLQQTDNSDEKELDEKTIKFNEARKAEIEMLNVQVPKPIQELNDRMRNASLSESQSASQFSHQNQQNRQFNSEQSGRDQRPPRQFNNEQHFGNRPQRQFKNEQSGRDQRPPKQLHNDQQFGRDQRPPGQFNNEQYFGNRPQRQFNNEQSGRDQRPPRQFNNEQSGRDQHPPKQFDNEQQQQRPPRQFNNDQKFGNRPASSKNQFNNRDNQNRRQQNDRNEQQSNEYPREFRPSTGRSRGGNQRSRGRGSGRGSNNNNQQLSSQQQQRGITLNLDLDFPQLGL